MPLSEPALAILRRAPASLSTNPQRDDRVFGTMSWSRAKIALDARIAKSGVKLAPWTLHDLRRSVATRMGDLGVAPWIVETILNHVSGFRAGVAGVYQRSTFENDKRRAVDLWGDFIERLVSGDQARIIPLRRA